MEMLFCLVLRVFQGIFMFLLPFWGSSLEPLGKDVSGAVCSPAKIAGPAPDQAAKDAGTLPDASHYTPFLICLRLNKAGLIAVVADIAVKGELESRLCAVILIITCERLKHRLFPPDSSFDFLTASGTFYVLKKLKVAAARICAFDHQTCAASLAPFIGEGPLPAGRAGDI